MTGLSNCPAKIRQGEVGSSRASSFEPVTTSLAAASVVVSPVLELDEASDVRCIGEVSDGASAVMTECPQGSFSTQSLGAPGENEQPTCQRSYRPAG